ncbi:HDOD domain-containing protein [Undibacterium sp. SXout11W]|uniref:HDOD domain-containing protein n=1 Tax=Undibacterium sp. SXout11W TaxID=3413050 RepID=UPI003BF376D7
MANPFNQFFQRLFGTEQESKTKSPPIADSVTPGTIPAVENVHPVVVENTLLPLAVNPTVTPVATPTQIVEINNATSSTEKLQIWKPAIPIDTLFFDWIMGYPGEGSVADTEQKVLQALYGLLASDLNDAVVVPRMPSVIPQLLASLRNKSVAVHELTRLIVKDVVLVGEVVNSVNSALYNPADRISSLEKAVIMLGEDGLRFVIAKVAFRPIINLSAGPYTRRAAPHLWLQSEKCALACHALSDHKENNGYDAFQAFLTGLMKNVGLIIAFRLLDQECEQPKFRYSAGFQHAMASVAATLSYRIAQRWDFPPTVIQALQQQAGGRKAVEWTALGQLLHDADLISKMRVLVNQAQLSRNDQQLKSGLNPAMADCFDNLNTLQAYELRNVSTNG